MGDSDGDVHLLGRSELTGVTTADVLLDLIIHFRPEIAKGNLLLHCPDSMVS